MRGPRPVCVCACGGWCGAVLGIGKIRSNRMRNREGKKRPIASEAVRRAWSRTPDAGCDARPSPACQFAVSNRPIGQTSELIDSLMYISHHQHTTHPPPQARASCRGGSRDPLLGRCAAIDPNDQNAAPFDRAVLVHMADFDPVDRRRCVEGGLTGKCHKDRTGLDRLTCLRQHGPPPASVGLSASASSATALSLAASRAALGGHMPFFLQNYLDPRFRFNRSADRSIERTQGFECKGPR